jgi:hypothetical protein
VAEDFFGLMTKYLNYCKVVILQSDHLPSVFQCGVVGFHTFETEAHKSIMRFFKRLFELATESKTAELYRPYVSKVVQERSNGMSFTFAIVQAFVGKLPKSYAVEVAEVFHNAMEFDKDFFGKNLQECLTRYDCLCFRCTYLTIIQRCPGPEQAKYVFFDSFLGGSKRDRISAALEFHRACSRFSTS